MCKIVVHCFCVSVMISEDRVACWVRRVIFLCTRGNTGEFCIIFAVSDRFWWNSVRRLCYWLCIYTKVARLCKAVDALNRARNYFVHEFRYVFIESENILKRSCCFFLGLGWDSGFMWFADHNKIDKVRIDCAMMIQNASGHYFVQRVWYHSAHSVEKTPETPV